MNKAITDGLIFMPPAFAGGLDVWSSEDGTPGSATYDGAGNAALVPADQDFGGALEILKQDTVTKLRYMGETPILPGCYLRVTARVKAISGNLPSVRIAGWAGDAGFAHVAGLVETGPEVALTAYGEIVEVSAIIGSGARGGVDMPWGVTPVYGHIGLDLTGANGGVVRIDDLMIEDISGAFLLDTLDLIDVRDYGAVGDGVTDCLAAFQAADAAANGKTLLVPAGSYLLSDEITIDNHIRFEGTLTMPADKRIVLVKNYDYNAYLDAFGDEETAFRKAFQALFAFTGHDALDLCGRRINLYAPVDVAALVPDIPTMEVRRVLRNGMLIAEDSTAWATDSVTSSADYSSLNPLVLTNVANIANIAVGSIVTGTGVGREVYVRAVNLGAGSLTLSAQLYGASPSQTYSFTRERYMLDFSGMGRLSKFLIDGVEFQTLERASAVMLCPEGQTFHFKDCPFKRIAQHAISSPGDGCQDLQIDRCTFFSSESAVASQSRVSVGVNVNANDAKIRDNRFQHLGTTMVLQGNGHLISGNHWFQGDGLPDGLRKAGVVFTYPNVKSIITGNYLDNSYVEMNNEHDANPEFASEYSFGGLTLTGNIFTANDVHYDFSWIVVKPYGPGHFIQGLSVQGNTFKAINGSVERVERVDTSFATLDFGRTRNVVFDGNTFNGVDQITVNPTTLEFDQPSAALTWTLDVSGYLPFGGWARTVEAFVLEGPALDATDAPVWTMPHVLVNQGASSNMVALVWPQATKGKVQITARTDNPI